MMDFLQQQTEKIQSYWGKRTTSQRVLISGLAVAVIVSFGFMIYWLNLPDYKVLYSNLFPEDAAKVVESLNAQKIPFKLTDEGKTVMVPADKAYELRLKIAGEGNLHGQGIGFEIFDQIKIGQTDFVQRINYQRALQGELSRTISEFPQVERARVHLVIPHKSLFIEEQAQPSASVVIKLKESQKLEPKQVQGIVNLVTMAVEGLKPNHVTINDTRGTVIYQPEKEDPSGAGLSSTQLDLKADMERKFERRIEEMLMPVVGPQKVIAKVNAQLDFSQKTIRKELYNPESQVVRSETKTEESTKGRANLEGGVPEANFRGDGFTGSLSSQDSNRESKTTNYEINKEEQQIIVPTGQMARVTVAVLVDGTYEIDKANKQATFIPRKQEELDQIKELVKNVVGFDANRGDTIEVSNIAFGAPEFMDEATLMRTMLEYMQRLGKPFLNGLLIFLFLIMVVRPVVMALIRPRVAEQEIEELSGLPAADERLALAEAEMDEEALDAARRLENIKAQALQLSESNMDQAVQVLKGWIKQEA